MFNFFFQEDLKAIGCGNPTCTSTHEQEAIFLHQACHFKKGVEAEYDKQLGILRLTCFICRKLVCPPVVVASRGGERA